MDLTIRNITKGSPGAIKARGLFDASFPPNEMIPFWLLLRQTQRPGVDFLAFYDGETFVGASYIVSSEDLTLVFYLAVDGSNRSKGYGSAVLAAIKQKYAPNRIVLDIELVDPAAPNYEQRVRRKAFYEKNGFTSTGYISNDRGDLYEILIDKDAVDPKEYLNLYRLFAGRLLYWRYRPTIMSKESVDEAIERQKGENRSR